MESEGAGAVRATRTVGKVAMQRARRDGDGERVWRGVDLTGEGAADEFGRLRATAALHPGAVLSGPSALRLFRFDVPDDWPHEITVTSSLRAREGLRVRSGRVPRAARVLHRGLPAVRPVRAVADALRLEAPPSALWVLDQGLRRGMHRVEIESELTAGRRGVRNARLLLPLGDAARESPLEAHVRWELDRHGVPAPVCQFVVPHARARLDFAWPDARVALEADGARWHDAPEALYRDRVRQNTLARLGWLILRCTWWDAHRRPAELAAAVTAALASRAAFA